MSTPTPPGAAGGPPEPDAPRSVNKPIEKFKAEKAEHKEIEKIKADKEHPEKIKPEKEHKLEVKEVKEKPEKEKVEKVEKEKIEKPEKEKIEKPEKEKHEGKEFKTELEKPPKHEKEILEKVKPEKEKHDGKEFKAEFEKTHVEKQVLEKGGKEIAEGDPATQVGDPAIGLDAATLLAHADALVASGQQLRHFIEQSQRPDLTGGALANEADLQDSPGEGG